MKSYSEYLQGFFPGIKVQKLSVNAGFTCPNRDGTISYGGCIYCRNDSFTPSYCDNTKSVKVQIEEGKRFFSRKYKGMKYLAYFQSFTATHHTDIQHLKNLYLEAANCPDIVGLIIGTRPDSLTSSITMLLQELNEKLPVFLEIGAETSFDETLRLINRNHTWDDVEEAVKRASAAGIHCGLHLIAGLPGEGEEMILKTVKRACMLPIDTIKMHQLQILYDTPLYRKWIKGELEISPLEFEEYIELCLKIIRIIPENIVIERFISQSPPEMVAAPRWNIKNYQFNNLLFNRLKETSI